MSKTNHSHPRKNRQLGSRFYGLLIVFAASAILIIFAIFFSQKMSQREKLANALPADRAVGFFEYNLDPGRSETTDFLGLVAKNTYVQGISDYLGAIVPQTDLFHQWYQGRGGLAVLRDANGQQMSLAFFLQVSNHEKALGWVNSLILDPKIDALLVQDYLGQKMMSFRSGQTYNLLLSNDYLVVSENLEDLKLIAETVAGQKPSLRNQPAYNQLISALPDQNLFFIYLDRAKLLETLSKNPMFLAGRLASYKLYFPFLKLFSEEAIAIKMDHDKEQKPILSAQHLALFNREALPTPDLFATDYFYTGNLDKLVPPNTIFIAGGVNLLDQKNKLQAYFKNRSTIYDLLFVGILNNLKDTLQSSGAKLDLDQDFFPLFQKEYLFFATAPTAPAKFPNLSLILQSSSPENDSRALAKVLLAVGPKLAAQVGAKPTPITLPDGTVGSEMKATLEAPLQLEVAVGGKFYAKQIQFSPDLSIFLYPDLQNQKLLVSTSSEAIGQILASDGTAIPIDYSLTKPSETYRVNLAQLTAIMPAAAALQPLQSITIARKFTEIGLLSTYQLGF